jgi:glycosyltransferase involved in cell wall biosynthesis
MRVLQIIDSLNAGGAERVAVNYANSLASQIDVSYLCATREEGFLKENLSNDVQYLFLNRKSTLDFKAIKKLNRYIKVEKIDVIHAHASSYFIGTIIKILNSKIVLIWHEHYGNREKAPKLNNFFLKICSYFFTCIIAVNDSLKKRSENKLLAKSVYALANYPTINSTIKITTLDGEFNKRIICLANLRPDKDHLNLLKAFKKVQNEYTDWTLHLVGSYIEDDYYCSIKIFIEENKLENHVFLYGSCADVHHILNQSTIAVLSSQSEGLPVALLEYGLSKLPVVATNVGDCNLVISNGNEGLLVESENYNSLAEALIFYINDLDLRQKVAENLQNKVLSTFSESSIIESLTSIYKKHQK